MSKCKGGYVFLLFFHPSIPSGCNLQSEVLNLTLSRRSKVNNCPVLLSKDHGLLTCVSRNVIMKFPTFVTVGIIGVAVAKHTVHMTGAQKLECRALEKIGGLGGGSKCCDYNQCGGCGFYQRCCYKPSGGGDWYLSLWG